MEIVAPFRIEARFGVFVGATVLVATASTFLLAGLSGPVVMSAFDAVAISVAMVVILFRKYACARVDEAGATLRPRWHGRFAAKSFSFRWEEVRNVRRWPSFARDPYSGLQVLLDRPKRFWTFHRPPANRVVIPTGIARNAGFLELLRSHVPPDRIAPGALDPRPRPHSLRRRTIGALILLALMVWAAWGVEQVIQSGSLWQAPFSRLTSYLGIATLIFCAELSPEVVLFYTAWYITMCCSGNLFVIAILAGPFAALAGCLSANVGALAAAIVLVLTGRPRWRHILLSIAFMAIAFVAGNALYGGIPVTRVAPGHLSMYGQCWTPSGDGFLMSTATRIGTPGDPSGSTDMQWYDENLRPDNRLALPHDPFLRLVGQEGALATTRTQDSAQLWFLPRRSGPARMLDAHTLHCIVSPSKRYIAFCRKVENGNAWERCDVNTGEILHLDVPATMKEASVYWGKDDSTLVWIAGSSPCKRDRSSFTWRAPLPEDGVFPEPGKLYRLWIWKSGAPPQSYAAGTEWLDSRYVGREGRLYICRVAENPPLRKEFVAIDFSGPEIVIAPAEEEAFVNPAKPPPSAVRRYEVIGPRIMSGRASIEKTATAKRRFLSRGSPLMESGDYAQWSPRGDRFLMTGLEWRRPADFWSWRRNPIDDLLNGSTVYMVNVESAFSSVMRKGEQRK